MKWEAVIGLEIHVHLKTRTKMFCRCAVGALDDPNTRTCPVCLAHPGTLPVPNKQAIEMTLRLGLALGCRVAERAIFHRKNYFYPDNPKGYQISQYDEPLCLNGRLRLPGPDGVAEVGITRAHLEEDAAKTLHVGGAEGRIRGATASLVDFNRAGTPLVEIVTEPDIRSAEQARRFLQVLRRSVPSRRLDREVYSPDLILIHPDKVKALYLIPGRRQSKGDVLERIPSHAGIVPFERV